MFTIFVYRVFYLYNTFSTITTNTICMIRNKMTINNWRKYVQIASVNKGGGDIDRDLLILRTGIHFLNIAHNAIYTNVCAMSFGL